MLAAGQQQNAAGELRFDVRAVDFDAGGRRPGGQPSTARARDGLR